MSFKISAEIGLLGENKFANVPFKGPNQGFDPSKESMNNKFLVVLTLFVFGKRQTDKYLLILAYPRRTKKWL